MKHINPYNLEQEDFLPPFVGRESGLLQIQQHINDQIGITFAGRNFMGKTALLKQFSAGINPSIVGVYISLKDTSLDNDDTWMQTLIQSTLDAVQMRGFEVTIEFSPDEDNPREWFKENCLPYLFRIIHSHRRIVLLLDDAEFLMKASSSNDDMTFTLKQDTFAYLQSLLHPQLGIILTIGLAFEYDLDLFYPLVDQNVVKRLSLLSQESSKILLQFTNLPYAFTDNAVQSIYYVTGGEPALLQRFGFHIYNYAQEQKLTSVDINEIKHITSIVYQENTYLFEQLWGLLNRNERHTLTALSSLTYDDPLMSIEPSIIERWLVQTDYPIDITSINAALRGLEYYELIQRNTGRITINAGLMQKWLLDNARLDSSTPAPTSTEIVPQRNALIIAILLGIMVIVVMFFAINSTSNGNTENTPVPTIPLSTE